MKSVLTLVFPNADLGDSTLDANVPEEILSKIRTEHHDSPTQEQQQRRASTAPEEEDSLLESMVDSSGVLVKDDMGRWDFYGQASGVMFVRGLQNNVQKMHIMDPRALPAPKSAAVSQLLESPMPQIEFSVKELPSKADAMAFCHTALSDVFVLTRFIHQPTFYAIVDRIYTVPSRDFDCEERRALPLLYAVLAIGCFFNKDRKAHSDEGDSDSYVQQGYKLFSEAHRFLNITSCRHLTCLQTICCLTIFLQSVAQFDNSYLYMGIAVRCALRLGLHRSIPAGSNPVEQEMRKRTFWALRQMDVYLSGLLGMPQMLSEEDIDQDYPLEIDDECIRPDGISPMRPPKVSYMVFVNAHSRLIKILLKVMKYIYPTTGLETNVGRRRLLYINYAKIREIEGDLQRWTVELNFILRPTGQTSPEVERVQQLLHMSFAHVEMVLYRPFLHYLSGNLRAERNAQAQACAQACLMVSQKIVDRLEQMAQKRVLLGSHWFTMYTTYFAVLNLLYFIHEGPPSSLRDSAAKNAFRGSDALVSFSSQSLAATRCVQSLMGLFQDLPERRQHEPSDQSADGLWNQVPQTNHATSSSLQAADSYEEPFYFNAALLDFESPVSQQTSKPATQPHGAGPSAHDESLPPSALSNRSPGRPSSSTALDRVLDCTIPVPVADNRPSSSNREPLQFEDSSAPMEGHSDFSGENLYPSDSEMADFLLAINGNDGPMFGVMPSSLQSSNAATNYGSSQPSDSVAICADPDAMVDGWA
ncbi:hypothetical protein DL98DRAFT_316562 [Cadophora sp. DSE1049]|nr:hypothetical protein DL98DRAFT_316562 [Cadophora sp. DSE1049]